MTSTFGSRLRGHRERQQISLADIADRTKIRPSLLESLERDDMRYWPAGIFRRSYVRAYAQAIGLDPEAIVREFLEAYPDPVDRADDVLAVARVATGSDSLSRKPRTRLQALFDSALSALEKRGLRTPQPDVAPATAPAFTRAAHDPPPPFLPLEELNALVSPDDAPMPDEPSFRDESSTAADAWLGGESPATGHAWVHDDAPREDDAGHAEPPAAVEDRDRSDDERPDLLMTLEPADEDDRAAAKPAHVRRSVTGIIRQPDIARRGARAQEVSDGRAESGKSFSVDLAGMALLCSRLARARNPAEVTPLMADAARLLDAEGLILWLWDAGTGVLWPSFNHGYRAELVSRMPDVGLDSDNAIADAFRAGETRIVEGSFATTGAVAVPVITPAGCTGVLALEMRDGGERRESVHALATILAAQFAALAYVPPLAQSTSA